MLAASAANVTPSAIMHRSGALVVLVAALASLGYSIAAGELSFLAFYIVCLVGGATIALKTADAEFGQSSALATFLVIYSINVLMVLAFVAVLVHMTGGPFLVAPEGVISDDEKFYGYGISIAEAWFRGETPEFPLGVKFYGYPYILAASNLFSYYFGDMSPVSPRILNAMVGALLPITVFRIAYLVYDDRKVARTAFLLTATFPIFSYYSALLLRDLLVAYMILVAILFFVRGVRARPLRGGLSAVFPVIATLTAIYLVRDLSAFVLLAAFGFYLYLRQPAWARLVAAVAVAVAVFQVATVIDLDAPKIQMYLTYYERAMEVFARIESQDSLGMRYILGAPFPFNILLRFPYTAIMPVPPLVGTTLLDIVRGSGALIWYFLFPLWLYGMWRSRKNPEANLLTVISLLFLAGIAMISIDLRHKTQYLPLAMIHVAYAIDVLRIKSEQVIVWTFLVLGLLAGFYLYLRFVL